MTLCAAKSNADWREAAWTVLSAVAQIPIPNELSPNQDNTGRLVNITLPNGSRIYPKPAPVAAADEIQAFLTNPDRLRFQDPETADIPLEAEKILQRRQTLQRRFELDNLPAYPLEDIGYVFIFGVGLGFHIAELAHHAVARTYVVIESRPLFMRLAADAANWDAIFQEIDDQGGRLVFIMGDNADEIGASLAALIDKDARHMMLDGSWALAHHPDEILAESRVKLNDIVDARRLYPGSMNSEIRMVRNACLNAATHRFHMIRHRRSPSAAAPVFIVGAGPSLDRDLSTIQRWRDHAIVVSAGTAIGPLLNAGIHPDIHVENENHDGVGRHLARLQEEHDLTEVVLAASSTVVPEAVGQFRKRWLYFRQQVSATPLLNQDRNSPLMDAGPMAVNAAAAACIAIGFRQIYLFGADCGRRGTAGHARHTLYERTDVQEILGSTALDHGSDYTLNAPGNFGGIVETTMLLDLSRRRLGALIAATDVRCINCSDGAAIPGASPLAARAISLPLLPTSRQKILDIIEGSLALVEPGAISPPKNVAIEATEAHELFTRRANQIATASSWWIAHELLSSHAIECRAANDASIGAQTHLRLCWGSWLWLLRLGAYPGRRIPSPDDRQSFRTDYLLAFAEEAVAVSRVARDLLVGISHR